MKRLILLLMILGGLSVQAQDEIPPLERFTLPPGFEISYYVEYSHAPRSMVLGDNGTLFVGTRTPSTQFIYAYVDQDGDEIAETEYIIDSGLQMPNAVAIKDGDLYVVDVNVVLRYDDIEDRLDDPPTPVVIYDGLPDSPQHGWRYAAFGPDERLYVAVGAPCNICEYDPDEFGLILSMTAAGEDIRIEARGVRNSVGFDWHPATNELWFADNGRDWVSDDLPPDEINHISAPNLDFGFPYCHGGFLSDPDFPKDNPCEGTEPPAFPLPAHVAPLGLRFYTGDTFPEQYHNQIFIAEHGSRNRTEPAGYQVSVLYLDENGSITGYEPFITGFLLGDFDYDAWSRPVDLLIMPDGSMLISDDHGDAIFRVRYVG